MLLDIDFAIKDIKTRYCRATTLHAVTSLSVDHAAFAGDVDGKHIASLPIVFEIYLLKYFSAVLPLTYICLISADFKIGEMSFAVTFFIELSELPVISHEAMTSHKAMPCSSKNALFSSMLSGV